MINYGFILSQKKLLTIPINLNIMHNTIMDKIFSTIPENALSLHFLQAGIEYFPDKSVHRKIAPSTIIAQGFEGYYEIFYPDSQIKLKEKEAFIAKINTPLRIVHHCETKDKIMQTNWLHIGFKLYNFIDFSDLLTIPSSAGIEYGNIFGELAEELLSPKHGENSFTWLIRRQEIAFKALRHLCEISKLNEKAKVFLDKEEQLLPIISYIGENLNRQISIDELANIACMSVSNFHSFFRKKMDISPMKFIKKMRLEEASFKLARTHNPISTIAEDLGFSSQFHFSRDFKSHYNITPSEYRSFYWKGDVLGNTDIK